MFLVKKNKVNSAEAHIILSLDANCNVEEMEEQVELYVFETRNFILTHPISLPLIENKLKYILKIIEACNVLNLFTKEVFSDPIFQPSISLSSNNFFELYSQYIELLQKVKLLVSASIKPLQLKFSLNKLVILQKEFESKHVTMFQQNDGANLFFGSQFTQDFSAIKISEPADYFALKNLISEIGLSNNILPENLEWSQFSEKIKTFISSENARIIKSNQLLQRL